MSATALSVQHKIDHCYRTYTGRGLAYLVNMTRDLELAEEVWHDSFSAAIEHWHRGMPDNPFAWLMRVARNKALDRLRHQQMTLEKSRALQAMAQSTLPCDTDAPEDSWFPDAQLKLIFACCHPALDENKQLPLVLTTICGLSTALVADALLVSKNSLEQRLTRAKRKLKGAGIPFSVPDPRHLHERLHVVLQSIYLMFNADDVGRPGLSAGVEESGLNPTSAQVDLAREAIRLTRHLGQLLPRQPEIQGLEALMLFHLARRDSRFTSDGQRLLLDQQDKTQWDRTMIEQADEILRNAMAHKQIGSYQLQAAIQGVHCSAANANITDWRQIHTLYALLIRIDDNPVIKLNASVATAFAIGMTEGLQALENVEGQPALQNYPLLFATKGYMLSQLARNGEAITAYQRALQLSSKASEKHFYQQRIEALKIIPE